MTPKKRIRVDGYVKIVNGKVVKVKPHLRKVGKRKKMKRK